MEKITAAATTTTTTATTTATAATTTAAAATATTTAATAATGTARYQIDGIAGVDVMLMMSLECFSPVFPSLHHH